MKVTKYSHACVRIEHEGRVLVIDPGTWSEPVALAGADAVLVTHQHNDHVDVLRLLGLGAPVFAPAEARIPGLEFTGVSAGEEFTAAGFRVRAHGGRHAIIHGGLPDCANLGYAVDEELYHPGDSLHVPEQAVETLMVPAQGSWLKTTEAIDFINTIRPRRAVPVHEAQLNARGIATTVDWFTKSTESEVRYLEPGESL